MSADEKPEDQITESGAIELDESRLDDASGGLLPAVQTTEVTTATSPSTSSVATYNFQNAWPSKWRG